MLKKILEKIALIKNKVKKKIALRKLNNETLRKKEKDKKNSDSPDDIYPLW